MRWCKVTSLRSFFLQHNFIRLAEVACEKKTKVPPPLPLTNFTPMLWNLCWWRHSACLLLTGQEDHQKNYFYFSRVSFCSDSIDLRPPIDSDWQVKYFILFLLDWSRFKHFDLLLCPVSFLIELVAVKKLISSQLLKQKTDSKLSSICVQSFTRVTFLLWGTSHNNRATFVRISTYPLDLPPLPLSA